MLIKYKYQRGKEIKSYNALTKVEDPAVYILRPDCSIMGVTDLAGIRKDLFEDLLKKGYKFYERVKIYTPEEVTEFIERVYDFMDKAHLTSESAFTEDNLESLYKAGWRLTEE